MTLKCHMGLRLNYRVSSKKLLLNTILLLVAATFLLSTSVNTHRALQHIQISVQHFHEAAGVTSAALHQAGNQHTAAGPVGTQQLVSSESDQAAQAEVDAVSNTRHKDSPAATPAAAAATGHAPEDAVSAEQQQQPEIPVKAAALPEQQQVGDAAQDLFPAAQLGAANAGGLGTYNASGPIPRIIHVNYMSGPQQLLTDALKPLSHFRKEWWLSCKTHNPSWTHIFWDEAACDKLLGERYPWFMNTWQALGNSTVLKSDAIRPFILHAYGGVYLDLDSECFTDMTPWIEGAQLIMQAEVGHTINNAQMASVSGHPVWSDFQRAIQARVAAGKRWPLETTGPHLLTDIVRAPAGNLKSDLPGAYTLPDGSRLAVYGPKQWFTPCAWNDWTCAVQLARDRPLIRARSKAAVTAATAQALAARAQSAAHAVLQEADGHVPHVLPLAAAHAPAKTNPAVQGSTSSAVSAGSAASQLLAGVAASPHTSTSNSSSEQKPQLSVQAAVAAGFPVMLGVHGVAGVHHFSGSWLGLDGSKSLSLRKEGVSSVLTFLYNGTGFVQQQCSQLRLLPDALALPASSSGSSSDASRDSNGSVLSALPIPVCWDSIPAAAAAGGCTVLSIRTQPPCRVRRSTTSDTTQQQQQQEGLDSMQLQQWLAAELAFAHSGCSVKLVTAEPVDLSQLTLSETHLLELQLQQQQQQQQQQQEQGLSVGALTSSSTSSSEAKALLARFNQVIAVLGVSADPFAEPPVHTLDTLVAAEVGTSRLTLLLLDLHSPQPAGCAGAAVNIMDHPPPTGASAGSTGSSSDVLDILNQLYVSSSTVLQQVDNLVLTLPAVAKGSAHKAFAAYQHLFQESGFVGYYYHSHAAVTVGGRSAGSGKEGVGHDMVTLGLTRA